MARAIAKYIRMSPRKLRRVINVIRGKDVLSARTTLRFMPYSACEVVSKVLASAVANAKENDKLNPEELRITKAYVDGSVTLRRWRAMSRGRAYPILKRTSHVTVEVVHDPDLVQAKPAKPSLRKPYEVKDKQKEKSKQKPVAEGQTTKHEHESVEKVKKIKKPKEKKEKEEEGRTKE